MKNCKKIIALVIAVIMAFSMFTYIVGAAPAEAQVAETVTTTPPNASPEDLTYVPPTIETEPGPDIGDILSPEKREELNNKTRSLMDSLRNFFEKIKALLDEMIASLFKA